LVREGSVGKFGRCGGVVFCGERIDGGCAFESCVEDGDDVVDAAHAATVAEFLRRGETPGDFPVVVVRVGGLGGDRIGLGNEWHLPEKTSGERGGGFEGAEHCCCGALLLPL
jgi:hypothetical protein